MHRDRKAAFTLIELLVVLAVIAIIAAILFPVFARAREKARQATCLSNEKQIAAAVLMYIGDYDEKFPFVLNWSANWNLSAGANTGDNGKQPWLPGFTGQEPQCQLVTVVGPYVKSAAVWYCPTVGPDYVWEEAVKTGGWKKGATMRDQGTSYQYDFLAMPMRCWCRQTLMGGKTLSILGEPARWPMISDEPQGFWSPSSSADPPPDAGPHSIGLNVAYGDGHAKYHRIEVVAPDEAYYAVHSGDGLYPGQ